VVITTPRGRVVDRMARGIGIATNNVAEYTAVLEGLQRARELGATDVLLRSDSKLLIEQLSGRFRVKNPTLQRLHTEVRTTARAFSTIRYQHVPREMNKEAVRAVPGEEPDPSTAPHGGPNDGEGLFHDQVPARSERDEQGS